MPRMLTLHDYVKALSGSGWALIDSLKMPRIRYTEKHHKLVQILCTKCRTSHWVLYQNVKSGKSKCCKNCSRVPTKERLSALVKKYDMLWSPTAIYKTKNGRRIYWMVCTGCKKGYWVAWSRFSQGDSTGCKSCAKSRSHGSLQDKTKHYKHPIRAAWRLMGAHSISRKDQRQWGSFEEFKEWSYASGYCDSSKPIIKKKQKHLPFSPSNCLWVATTENGRNTVKERYK